MPALRVELFEGRSAEQKAALAHELTQACMRVLGVSADGVDVVFYDVARSNWATAGVMWSERAKAAAPVAGKPKAKAKAKSKPAAKASGKTSGKAASQARTA